MRSAAFWILWYIGSYEPRTEHARAGYPPNAAPETGFRETSHQVKVP
jgi:hypothetical protein